MLALHRFLLLLTCLGLHALGSEIIKGKEAKKNSLQYMVSVQSDGAHQCGGFLISDEFVVTAAHCLDYNPTSVVIGTHDLRKVHDDTMRFEVKKCKNPSYEYPKKGNDIMLLKLSKKVGLNERVKLIDYPKKPMSIEENTKCIVAGWGATKTDGAAVHVLQEVDVSVINLKICEKQWENNLQYFPANVICAGGYNTDKGFCQGDSGGPLVCDGKAVGIVSFNMEKNCNYPLLPNVYTDISKYHGKIEEIKKHCEE